MHPHSELELGPTCLRGAGCICRPAVATAGGQPLQPDFPQIKIYRSATALAGRRLRLTAAGVQPATVR